MPILRIRTSNIKYDGNIPTSIFNYPDSSILAYIMEDLHLQLIDTVRVWRSGEVLWVISPNYS